jgi:hypothetical protein
MSSNKSLIRVRDIIVSNFFVTICCIVINDKCYDFDGFYSTFLSVIYNPIPFSLLKKVLKLLNINVIYKVDNIYNISIDNNHILPIIMDFYFENNNEIKDLSDELSQYNSIIPLNFFINNEMLQKYKKIKLKYLNNNKIIERTFDILSVIDLPIYKLFIN